MAETYKWSNLKKFFYNRVVLDIKLLELEGGKRYIIMGENGSGKSTLLKILSNVLISDSLIYNSPEDIVISYMPQKPYIFNMSVLNNMKIGSENRNESEFENLLEQLNISRLKACEAVILSGGEKQKLAFARMVIQPCNVLILDEPSSAMDENGVFAFEKLLVEFQKQSGCTVIMTTHDIIQAKRLADKILYLRDGRLV